MCLTPVVIKNPRSGLFIEVPCRKCPECLASRSSLWCSRLDSELRYSDTSYFVTLTYDDDNLPLDYYAPLAPLVKSHLQDFIKRVRFYYPKSDGYNIRYFAVGEYGDTYLRPHYHMCLFNLPLDLPAATAFIRKVWNQGFVQVGPLTSGGIRYCCKYMLKCGHSPLDSLPPPFMICSKRPYIGNQFISRNLLGHSPRWFVSPRSLHNGAVQLSECMQRHLRREIGDEEFLLVKHLRKIRILEYQRDLRRSYRIQASKEVFDYDASLLLAARLFIEAREAKYDHSLRTRSFFSL